MPTGEHRKGVPPANFNDLTGQVFGHLTVIEQAGRYKYGQVLWRCRCDCGKERIVMSTNLMSCNTQSCGHTKRGPRNR